MNVPLLRWLVAALVLTNLAYFWYASTIARRQPVAPTPVVGAHSLALLSELPLAANGPGATAGPGTLRCWELGPLDNGLQMDLSELFARVAMPMRNFRRESVDAADYWVYLAVTERAQLAGYQQHLEASGVESYVIGGGELEGNLSLGLFTSRKRAEAVAQPLRELELPVVIHSRQRRQDQTWLRVNSREVAALGWSEDLANLTLWPRPAILSVNCDEDGLSAR